MGRRPQRSGTEQWEYRQGGLAGWPVIPATLNGRTITWGLLDKQIKKESSG